MASGRWWTTSAGTGLCNYNPETHGGPHLHHPVAGPDLGPVGVTPEVQAERVMRWFARDHETFDAKAFAAVVKAWRSGSRKS